MALVVDDAFRDTWVPVERRWHGIDRRTIAPFIVSFLLGAVFIVLLPAIDKSLEYDRETKAGDVINLGSGITFVPAEGWGFIDGLLTTDPSITGQSGSSRASLTSGGVTFNAGSGDFDGSPDDLIGQINQLNETYKSIDNSHSKSDPVTFTTNSGITGVTQSFAGVNIEGVLVAFVINGVGVEIVVNGPPEGMDDLSDTVDAMLRSFAVKDSGDAS